MLALETLHGAGYVHLDVSPGNLCFSQDDGIWKLIDFDQSLPIEVSLKRQRTFGTPPFVSERAKLKRILEPVDDYIALAKVVSEGFPFIWYLFYRLPADLKNLLEIIEAVSNEQ